MTLIARLENIRQPHNEPYADGSLDGRDSTLLCSTQVDVEEPAVQTIPPSALLCQCLGRSRRSSPVHTATQGRHWKLHACLCLTFPLTCLVSCSSSPPCPHVPHVCYGVGAVSCHVSRSQWALPSPTMGWHEHWDALCTAVSTPSWTGRHWTKDVRIRHPSNVKPQQPAPALPPRRPQTLPVPEVAMPPPAWGTEASEHKANLMPSGLRNPPGGDSSTRHTLYPPPLPPTMTSSFPPRRSRGPNQSIFDPC